MHYLWITACLSLCCPAIAATWIVDDDGPADFDNIQNAISIASAGDTVLVEPGIYTRSLTNNFVMDLLGKPITVRATGSPDATIIDGEGLCTNVVVCSSGEDSGTRIEGFRRSWVTENGSSSSDTESLSQSVARDAHAATAAGAANRAAWRRDIHLSMGGVFGRTVEQGRRADCGFGGACC